VFLKNTIPSSSELKSKPLEEAARGNEMNAYEG
jgi:hypothetical protein